MPSSGIEHAGDTMTLTVAFNRAVTVTGGTPTLTLNDGGTAVYDAAATAALGDPTKMVFSYTVGASDLPVNGLSIVRGDQNGAVIADAQGHGPDFSNMFAASLPDVRIETPPTTLVSVAASPIFATEQAGDVVTFTLTMNRAVTITGGTPTLTLNDGGVAVYDAVATAALGDPTMLVFRYEVGASDLPVNGLSFVRGDQNGVVIVDAAGKGPDFSQLFATSFPGIQVVPAAPGIQSVGTEIDVANKNGVGVAELANGNFATAWLDGSAVHAQIVNADGDKVGAESLVPMPLPMIAGSAHVSVTALASGGFAVAWNSYDFLTASNGVGFQLFDANGAPSGVSVQANTATGQLDLGFPASGVQAGSSAIAALANGNFVVTWNFRDSSAGLTTSRARIFDANGVAVGGEMVLGPNDGASNPPAIAGLADGHFIAIWRQQSDLQVRSLPGTVAQTPAQTGLTGQIFDSEGNRLGPEFAVNSNPQFRPERNASVAALPTGGFVVTWEDWEGDSGTVFDVLEAQQFDASGNKVGPHFYVDANVTAIDKAIQYQPKVAGLADGSFVITWQDIGGTTGDSSGSGIKAQVFNANQAVGGEFLVNTQTNGDQVQPQIVALHDGGFAIVWDDGGSSTKGQIYTTGPAITTIATGTTLEIPIASSANLAFAPGGATLRLDNSAAFAGTITGLGHGDSIDLADVAFSSAGTILGYSANAANTGGHVTVGGGAHIAALTLLGQYAASSFVLSADGHGGTLITTAAPEAAAQQHLAAPV